MTPCSFGFHRWSKWMQHPITTTDGKKSCVGIAQTRACEKCGKKEMEKFYL